MEEQELITIHEAIDRHGIYDGPKVYTVYREGYATGEFVVIIPSEVSKDRRSPKATAAFMLRSTTNELRGWAVDSALDDGRATLLRGTSHLEVSITLKKD